MKNAYQFNGYNTLDVDTLYILPGFQGTTANAGYVTYDIGGLVSSKTHYFADNMIENGVLIYSGLSSTIVTGNNYQLLVDSSGNITKISNYYYDSTNSYFATASGGLFTANIPTGYLKLMEQLYLQ